jgi:AraC family transcriptional regulator
VSTVSEPTVIKGEEPMNVEIKNMPELRLAAVRHVGPYEGIPEAFERIGQFLGSDAALFRQHGATMIAVYHDDPEAVLAELLRSDAAIVVPPGLNVPDGLVDEKIPAGRFACVVHVGPYEQLGDVWRRFKGEWLPASGHHAATGPSYEIYLNDPATTPKADLRTEMCIPVGD